MALSTIFNSVIGQLGMPVFAQISDEQQQENALFGVVDKIVFLSFFLYAGYCLPTFASSYIYFALPSFWLDSSFKPIISVPASSNSVGKSEFFLPMELS